MTTNTKLLIVTQAVDQDDPVLGFIPSWLREFSKDFGSLQVICLKEGKHTLPPNVRIHSLGKESGESRTKYVVRFFRYVWNLRRDYDVVLVHMNQEYVLLGGWLWKLLGKRVYLWRNHYSGGRATDVAVSLCTKVFCTSKYSYTAKYAKTILMPVGIDTEIFKVVGTSRKGSVLSIGRIAPSKRFEILVDAIGILTESGLQLEAHIYGDALPKDAQYEASLHMRTANARIEHLIQFHPGVRNTDTPALYGAHQLFVNCSESGMYDKTIFEALACGALSVASSRDYAEIAPPELVFKENDAADLAAKIEFLLALQPSEKERLQKAGAIIAEKNSLKALGRRLVDEVH